MTDEQFVQSLIRQTGTTSASEAKKVLLTLAGIQPRR